MALGCFLQITEKNNLDFSPDPITAWVFQPQLCYCSCPGLGKRGYQWSQAAFTEFPGSRIRPSSGDNLRHMLIYFKGYSCFNWQLDLYFLTAEDVMTRINGITVPGYNFWLSGLHISSKSCPCLWKKAVENRVLTLSFYGQTNGPVGTGF